MPHFIIDCSKNILEQEGEREILKVIYDIADATGLFIRNDIKVRLNYYEQFIAGDSGADFIHVFGYIMEGRTTEQKANLSREMVTKLTAMFPDVKFIAMNVAEFEKATYCNREMVEKK